MTTTPRTLTCSFPPRPQRRTSRPQRPLGGGKLPSPLPTGRVPRVARLLALTLRCQQLVQTGVIANYAALADLGHVSRARVTQILNLLLLAPDLQEALLFLPRTERGRDPIHLRQLQPLTRIVDWREQRKRWQALLSKREPAPSRGCLPERAAGGVVSQDHAGAVATARMQAPWVGPTL